MNIKTLKKESSNFLKRKKAINETTAKAYKTSLKYFIYYTENIYLTHEINQKNIKHILEGFKGCLNNGLTITEENKTKTITFKPSTMNTHIKRVETFLRSLDFDIKINKYRVNERKYKALSYDQLLLFFSNPEECFKNKELALRTQTLIKFLFNTGFRINEALNIELENLYTENNNYFVKIHEKGRPKAELTIIDISKELYEMLIHYVNNKKYESKYLFSSLKANNEGKANKLTNKEASKNIIKLSKYIDAKYNINTYDIIKNNSTHVFRHSRAVYLLNIKKCDILEVKEILRHSNINTTMLYLNEKEETIKNLRINNDVL